MSEEKLPIKLKNNQLAVNKRNNKRTIEGFKRVGKILLSAGVAVTGLAMTTIGGTIPTIAGFGIYLGAATNAGLEVMTKKISKDSMFVQSRGSNGEIKISQSLTNIKAFQKLKGFNATEKGAMMGLELLVSLQNIKQKYEDQGIQTESSRDGENNIYPQVYSTTTHGINTKTIEALEQLGYLQIERKEPKKKSNLFLAKMGFGQYKEAIQGFISSFSKDESKKHEVQMYDMAFRITDKPLNLEEIYQTYTELKDTTGKNPMRKPIKRLGIIIEALRSKNVDIQANEIGETIINYKAQESFASRMKREQVNLSAEYRKANYIGGTIEQTPVQKAEQLRDDGTLKIVKER